jgi:hypothetical protein
LISYCERNWMITGKETGKGNRNGKITRIGTGKRTGIGTEKGTETGTGK